MTLASEPDPSSGRPVGKPVNTWPATPPGDARLIGNFGRVEKLDAARHGADLWAAVHKLPLRNAALLEAMAVLWIHLALKGGRGREWAFLATGREAPAGGEKGA